MWTGDAKQWADNILVNDEMSFKNKLIKTFANLS